MFDIDTESGPPPDYGFMHDPQELVEMWIADCWLMNRDREQDGNMRLALASSGRFSPIAADHSDCFLGAGRFADGSYVSLGRQHGAVPYPATATLVERAVCELGCLRALSLVGRIVAVAKELPQVIGCVPAEWWHQSGVSGMDVVTCLQERAGRMRSIIDIDRLEGIRRACNDGGQLL